MAACSDDGSPRITGLAATLTDDVRSLPDGEVECSTTWRMCWDAVEGAAAYELETLTSEGAPRTPTRSAAPCHELSVATGRGTRERMAQDRRQQLAFARSSLAFRVRAVLPGGEDDEGSDPVEAGAETGR